MFPSKQKYDLNYWNEWSAKDAKYYIKVSYHFKWFFKEHSVNFGLLMHLIHFGDLKLMDVWEWIYLRNHIYPAFKKWNKYENKRAGKL